VPVSFSQRWLPGMRAVSVLIKHFYQTQKPNQQTSLTTHYSLLTTRLNMYIFRI
jgi:hypothetical protein